MNRAVPDRGSLLVWASYGLLSLYFTYPLLASGARLGIGDWDALLFQHASVMRSVYEYGQLPFWNPWYCGGNVLWQNPQVPLLTPAYLFTPFVSVAFAIKLTILLHYLAGFAGMHVLLTRIFDITWRPLLIYLASLFVLAGGPALHLIVGHSTFLPYFYLPWLLFYFIRAITTGDLRAVVGAAAVMALSLYAGGLHLTFMAAMGLILFSLTASLTRREWRPLVTLALVGGTTALLAAPKLVPMMAFVSEPRLVDIRWFHRPDLMTPELVLHAFADPFQYPRMLMRAQKYGWHEYGNYLGFLGAPLICAAFVWLAISRPRRSTHWLAISLAVTALALFGLMVGEAGSYAPFVLLTKLPLMSQFRLPSRYTLVLVLFAVGVVAAVARQVMTAGAMPRELGKLAAILLVFATASLAYQNRVHLAGAFPLDPVPGGFGFLSRPPAPSIDAATDAFTGDSPMMRAMMQNRAVLRCNEPLSLPGQVDPGQAIVFPDGPARLSEIRFTPNRVTFAVLTSGEPARVVFNSKFIDGWRSTFGTLELDQATGLSYIAIPPLTATRVEIRFSPERLTTGLVLFGAGLLLAAALWRRRVSPPRTALPPASARA